MLTLRRGDAGPIAPELGSIKSQNVSAALREIKAGEHYELDVTLSPPWPNKRITTSLNVKTGVVQVAEETILVTADVVPRVRAVPDRFNIPRLPTKPSESSVSVVWDRNAPQKIVKAEASDERLSVRIEDEGEGQKVVLAVPAGYDSPRRPPHVTLTTDDQEVKVLQVPIRYKRAGKRTSSQRASKPARAGKAAGPQRKAATTATNAPPQPSQTPASAKPEGTAPQGSEKSPSIKTIRQVKPIKHTNRTANTPEELKKKEKDKKVTKEERKDPDR